MKIQKDINLNENMKHLWEIKKLGDLSEVITKGTTPTSVGFKFETKGINFVKVESITNNGQFLNDKFAYISEDCNNNLKRSQLIKGDILFSIAGALGRTAYVTSDILPANTNQALSIIRLKKSDKVLPEFILKALSTGIVFNQIQKFKGGVAQQNLSLAQVQSFQIPIPPLSEQKRIVAILDETFVAIDKARANAEKNLANAREVFEGYLNGVFSSKGVGWEEKRFDEICVLQRGFDLPTHVRTEGNYPLVSSNGITDRINNWKVKGPGVVTGRSGTIGNVHYIEEDFWPLNTALYIKEFNGNYERCVYYFLKQFDLNKYKSGAGVPTLNRNNVHSVRIHFPKSTKEQKQIVIKLDNFSLQTKRLEEIYKQKIADLEELKKSILQKAFEGEL